MAEEQALKDRTGAAGDTRTRLLDVAERMFAESGISATSLRGITQEAGANLASIHYYFGSKEELIRQVFARRIEPLNRERLRLLDDLEHRHPDGQVPLEKLVEAFISPLMRMGLADEKGQRVFPRLFGAVHSEPIETQRLIFVQFQDVARRFIPAFGRVLPHLPEPELLWRFKFLLGAMVMSIMPIHGVRPFEALNRQIKQPGAMLDRIIPFVVAGMQAPAPRGGS